MRKDLDAIWLDAATWLGIPVERGGDAYVHFDGEALHIASDEHLDDDDTVAQLVFHEICHMLVAGPAMRQVRDWGLDNSAASHDDETDERAAVRLQAHLCNAYGLRRVLFPTTDVRVFFDRLGDDALAGDDAESASRARIAAVRAARIPVGKILRRALERTAAAVGAARHASGFPLHAVEDRRCGACVWRDAAGHCGHVEEALAVAAEARACTRFEAALDCLACGACCRAGFDRVEPAPGDVLGERHPDLVARDRDVLVVLRVPDGSGLDGLTRCAALDGPPGGPYACRVYDERPTCCRDFPVGGDSCLTARRRVGLSAT